MLSVIGIVGDVRRVAPGEQTRTSQIYYPVGQTNGLGVPAGRVSTIADYRTLVIRADDPARVVPSLPAAVHEIDPLVVIWKTDLVEHLFADAIARPRVVFVLMTTFATFGLVLAAPASTACIRTWSPPSNRRSAFAGRLARGHSGWAWRSCATV
jgi:hypothetical protein